MRMLQQEPMNVYFMMETITACHLIGVDPFNQPAVELGKKLTKDYLSGVQSY